jgi:hypothetical protein
MSESSDESSWVVAPPGLEIQIAVGPDAHLTPEIRGALDGLLRALENDTEVEGFKAPPSCPTQCVSPGYGACNPQGVCAPKMWMPCAAKSMCSIISTSLT